jgi:hypothetical protein
MSASGSIALPLRPPLVRLSQGNAVNLRQQFGRQERLEGLEFGVPEARSILEAAGFKLRAHSTPVRSVEPEDVSEPDRVKTADQPFWECWRDEDDFGLIDAMIARGWGDEPRFFEAEDALLPNPRFERWTLFPGPDRSFSRLRRAHVSEGLRRSHAARKTQERLFGKEICNPDFVKK